MSRPRSKTRRIPSVSPSSCAMWMTGFDVECLSTLYIDKPMKAHTLMQAIARANRVYPGKDFGLIVGLQRHAAEPARGAGAIRVG